MAYNKAKEERKWRIWKEAEEKQMRSLGVDKDTIEKLRIYDWAIFNSDRRYYEKLQDTGTYLEEVAEDTTLPEIKMVNDFLDSIENQELYQVLIKVDKLTIQIALWKMDGYSSSEISEKCGLTVSAINFRLWHLRKKLKNIL
ncbi:helix-turn-helix transcriptional regulator [Longicatena caecimuris]|uniref:helix-turn-helix transcriptional regulator n=1 Tax=Bacillota TaxID=1239 RepID=UPI00399102DD